MEHRTRQLPHETQQLQSIAAHAQRRSSARGCKRGAWRKRQRETQATPAPEHLGATDQALDQERFRRLHVVLVVEDQVGLRRASDEQTRSREAKRDLRRASSVSHEQRQARPFPAPRQGCVASGDCDPLDRQLDDVSSASRSQVSQCIAVQHTPEHNNKKKKKHSSSSSNGCAAAGSRAA